MKQSSNMAEQAAQARLAAIINSSDDAIISKTLDGIITSWNPGAEKIFGYSAAEAVGKPMLMLFPPEHAHEEPEILAKIGRGESVRHFETVRVRKDGQRIDVSVTISPIVDPSGKIIGASKIARDITERKRVEESLLRLAAIISASNDAIISKTLGGKITSWNPGAERMFGYSAAEAIGQPLLMLFPPERVNEEDGILTKLRRGEKVETFETVRMHKDGRHIEVSVSVSPLIESTGKILGATKIVGTSRILRDITQLKQVEAALRESQSLYASLVEQMPAGVFRKDVAGRYVFVNHYFLALRGATAEQFLGKLPAELPPGEAAFIPDSASHHEEIIRTGQTLSLIDEYRHADGRTLFFHVVKSPVLDAAGKTIGTQGMLFDLTARKQAEDEVRRLNAELEQRVIERTAQLEAANTELDRHRAELQSLFESLPGLYLVLLLDFTIVAASDAYLKATMTTREGILGRGLFEVFPDNPNDPAGTGTKNLRESFEHVRQHATAHTMAIQKYDVRRPDGVFEERYWSPINSPVFGLNREVKYIVHRVEDVTDFVRQKSPAACDADEVQARMQRMEAEIFLSSQKVQEANRQLEAANKELEAFSYSVSHDLRAPLRAVNGFAGIVLEDYGAQLPDEGRKYLARIRAGGQRMGELIDDLLAFSHLSRQPMTRHAVATAKLVESVLEELKPQHAGREIEFRIGDLPPCDGDSALLKQVWVNLLSNAIKYSRGRKPALVEIGCTNNGGGQTYFVRDNGTGFDMQYAHKLFGVFQRLHRADEFEGTGVGLAIVQRIIHRHGGRVWAEAKANHGATFYFTLEGEQKL